MLVLVVAASSSVVVALCSVIAVKIKSGVINRAVKQGLEGCPPSQRAKVLMAAAELANRVYGDRSSNVGESSIRALIHRGRAD